ncbi:hypothetical protein [Bacillus thuringiensis]|uniref:hypothetical protein n=1 Tax=Bacillus thuringiensis TaxID=1428 RepID=UPI000BFE943F|nr:hypothetical protein [Bacillus thuringiensis]MCC6082750.1 hypothetical protein [Bacillus thuringiensis]PGV89406.1 hypothetical protein COD85_00400 [Bacillus thuringiensis]
MFFPCLDNLKKVKFPKQSVELFDWWLGTRRQNTLSSLNPLQFSLDCEIDIQHSLKLFSHCVFDPEIELLRRKYTVYCPSCSHKVFKSDERIAQKEVICQNCGTKITANLLPDSTELTFELLKAAQAIESESLDFQPRGGSGGKAQGLRVSDMDRYIDEDDSDTRRLFDCL